MNLGRGLAQLRQGSARPRVFSNSRARNRVITVASTRSSIMIGTEMLISSETRRGRTADAKPSPAALPR